MFHRVIKNLITPALTACLCAVLFSAGCKTPTQYKTEMNETAAQIIKEKQLQATGSTQDFTIDRPANILRRRLIKSQNLPVSSPASLGTDKLEKIEYWPENEPLTSAQATEILKIQNLNQPVTISLLQALQVAARNSFDYQSQKEDVFRSALALEIERDEFRNTFFSQVESLISTDSSGSRTISGMVNSSESSVSRKFKSGAQLTSSLAVDLANLMTLGGASSLGIAADATIEVPLLRGSGEHIVTEPLTQAERNVIYAIWDFERFKKEFAVDTASRYLAVLQQLDNVKNTQADYKSRIASVRRTRRLADAGRIQEIEVDQAVQNELSARQRWISSTQSYKRQLDSFKTFIGLTPDANIKLDPNELQLLVNPTEKMIDQIARQDAMSTDTSTPPADAPVVLEQPDTKNAGPYEINENTATLLAFENRLDLKTNQGKVFDAQRKVVVAADDLGAELTFAANSSLGQRRSTVTATQLENAQLRIDKGVYSAGMILDLPFERTAESINYRNSFINLEKAVRDVQSLEDSIKSSIRNTLRTLLEARENRFIQAKAVYIALKRVRSVNMFLEAGRAQTRDLLEAQDALLEAQNRLTAAVVDYRIAELTMQSVIGVLKVNENGLWQEFQPGDV